MHRLARSVGAGIFAIGVLLAAAPAAHAWYGPAIYLTPTAAVAGAKVMVLGSSFDQDDPVQARLDALDGMVLGTFTPDGGNFQGPLDVPASIKPGSHVLVFTQLDKTGAQEEIPTRAALVITSATSGTPLAATPLASDSSARPAALTVTGRHPIAMGTLILVALGAAVVAGLVAGLVVLTARRSGSRTARVGA